MSSPTSPPQGRRWRLRSLWQRLALSYVVITVGVLLVLDLGIRTFDWLVLRRDFAASQLAGWATRAAWEMSGVDLRTLSADEALFRMGRLHQQLREVSTRTFGIFVLELEPAPEGSFSMLLVDASGRVLVSDPLGDAARGTMAAEVLPADEAAVLASALAPAGGGLDSLERGSSTVVAARIVTGGGAPSGALFVRTTIRPLGRHLWDGAFVDFLAGAGGAFVVFGIIGLGFGVLTALRLTRRLRRIGAAAESWSRGEFSVRADDTSADEIGQLARRLNEMSIDLQDVLRVRQDLAAVDERHRLARELHDAVKQQVFALGLQLAAARSAWDTRAPEARTRLEEAERIVASVQQELVDLIRQLRPSGAASVDLAATVRQLGGSWSRQHGIAVDVDSTLPSPIPAAVADDLYRIVQEALANVARHSGATTVRIELSRTGREVAVEVRDDGRGFDASRVTEGMGLHNMRERATALPGGELYIGPDDRHGTRVRVRCRIPESES